MKQTNTPRPFMQSFILFSAMALCVTVGTASSTRAQVIPDTETEKAIDPIAIFNELPEDIQQNIITEAQKVESDCRLDSTYATYHDCRCIADKFLAKRVLSGPAPSTSSLAYQLDLQCINVKGIKVKAFDQCLHLISHEKRGNKAALCSCFANKVAQSYNDKPDPNYRYLGRISGDALVACRRLDDAGQLDKDTANAP